MIQENVYAHEKSSQYGAWGKTRLENVLSETCFKYSLSKKLFRRTHPKFRGFWWRNERFRLKTLAHPVFTALQDGAPGLDLSLLTQGS